MKRITENFSDFRSKTEMEYKNKNNWKSIYDIDKMGCSSLEKKFPRSSSSIVQKLGAVAIRSIRKTCLRCQEL